MEIPLPDIFDRLGWNAQDPLASCYHYLIIMKVVVPAIFGVRMCFNCPDCNIDLTDSSCRTSGCSACSDYMGTNMKATGGYAGLATA